MPTGILTISQYTANPPQQVDASSILEVRGWYSRDWISIDGVTPVFGNSTNGEQGPYYSTTPTLNASGEVVVPAHDVQITVGANPTANYFEGLWVDGAFTMMLMPNTQAATGWQIPSVYGDPIAYDEIATYNRARRLVYAPDTYFTADQVIQEIERLAGNFDYMAVGVNGIGQASFAPPVASAPVVLMENDPRVGSWFNILSYFASTSNSAAANAVAIANAVTAATSAGGGLFIPAGTFPCASVTISVPCFFAPGNSILQPPTGQTITFTKDVIADRSKHFDNALPALGVLTQQGTISFTGNNSLNWVFPEWWGGIPGVSTTTQMRAFQAAVDSGIPVSLANTGTSVTSYELDNSSSALMLNNNTYSTATIEGAGQNATLVRFTSSLNPGIKIEYPDSGAPSAYLRNFYMRGSVGASPSFTSGNYGIYEPGGASSKISNLVIENVQIDQFGDAGICLKGRTGPVRIINPIINDVGNYGILLTESTDAFNPSDVTIDGGSIQAGCKGGIGAIGVTTAILSLTIRDTDIEPTSNLTKPLIHFEQVHGALVEGVSAGSQVDSLLVGDANIYLGPGVYGCRFDNINNNIEGATAAVTLHNVHADSSAVQANTFSGGQYENKPTGSGYVYVQEVGAMNNWFDGINLDLSNFNTGHQYAPMREVNIDVQLGTVATTGATSAVAMAPVDGFVSLAYFAGSDALAADNTNYLTFTIRNLGPGGGGTTQILLATDVNTTKLTGGSAIVANVKRSLTLKGTAGIWPPDDAALQVAKGDRLLVSATATGTLANTVTFSEVRIYFIEPMPNAP